MPLGAIASIVITIVIMAAVILIAEDISQRGGPAVVAMTSHQPTFFDYNSPCLGIIGNCVESFGSILNTNQDNYQSTQDSIMPEIAPPLIQEKLGIQCTWGNESNNKGYFVCFLSPLPIQTLNDPGCLENTVGTSKQYRDDDILNSFETRYECDFDRTAELLSGWFDEYGVCNVEGTTHDECMIQVYSLVQHNPEAHTLSTLAILTNEQLEELLQSRSESITPANQPATVFGFIDIDSVDFENVQPTEISNMYYAIMYLSFGALGFVAILAAFVLIFEDFEFFPPGTATNIIVKSFIALPIFPMIPLIWDLIAMNLHNITLIAFNPLNTNNDPAYYATIVFQHASVLLPPGTFDEREWLSATINPENFVRNFLFNLIMGFGESLVLILVMINFFVTETGRVILQLVTVSMLPFAYVLHMIPQLQGFAKIIFMSALGLMISPIFVAITFALGGAMMKGISPDSDPFFVFIVTITIIALASSWPVTFSPLLSIAASKVNQMVQTSMVTAGIGGSAAGGPVGQIASKGTPMALGKVPGGGPSSGGDDSAPKTESDYSNSGSSGPSGGYDGGYVPGSKSADLGFSPSSGPSSVGIPQHFAAPNDYSFVNNNEAHPSNVVHSGGVHTIDNNTSTQHMTEVHSSVSESTPSQTVIMQSEKMGETLNSHPDSMQDFTQSYIDERNIQFSNSENQNAFESKLQSDLSQGLKSNPESISKIYDSNEKHFKI